MRIRLSSIFFGAAFILGTCALTSCSSLPSPQLFREGHGESLMERLAHEASADDEYLTADIPMLNNNPLLAEVNAVEVQSLTHEQPFQTLARTGQMTQYPCSSCHIEPLAELQATQSGTEPRAHWEIAVDHADASVMTCTTCHNSDNMNTLRTVTGDTIEFDHSYQLCAQCHSNVAADWVGGAHGKRVGGWTPPRVVNNCVDCHNPHEPQWDIRWPAVTSGGSR